jgi:hypothetical protein
MPYASSPARRGRSRFWPPFVHAQEAILPIEHNVPSPAVLGLSGRLEAAWGSAWKRRSKKFERSFVPWRTYFRLRQAYAAFIARHSLRRVKGQGRGSLKAFLSPSLSPSH